MRKPKPPKLVTVAIFTTITVIFWIFFEVYQTFSSAPSVKIEEDLLLPLNPILDVASLRKLEARTFFEESDVESVRFSDLSTKPVITVTPPLIEPTEEIDTGNIEVPSEISPVPESE